MPIGVRNLIANAIVAGIVYAVALWDVRVALALLAYIILTTRDLLERKITGEG